MKVEREKKYVLKEGTEKSFLEMFKEIIEIFNLSSNAQDIINLDTYYDKNNILDAYKINIRKRIVNGKEVYTVKKPIKESSITERREEDFNTLDSAFSFIKNEWDIPIKDIDEILSIRTIRKEYQLLIDGELIEIVFDLFTPRVGICEFSEHAMVEFELKGENIDILSKIDTIMKKISYVETCNNSKKEIALEEIKSKTRINPFKDTTQPNNEDIKEFFVGKDERLARLKDLDRKKKEVTGLKNKFGNLHQPVVVTLSGTPRAGKTSAIQSLYEFFKKTGLNTKCLEEPAGIIYATLKNREEKQELLKDRIGFVDMQYSLGTDYINKNLNGSDLILCDRGIIDPLVWYDMYYQMGMVNRDKYLEFLNKMKNPQNYINYFYGLYADEREAMKRDYLSSISIEERTTMSRDNVSRYNASLLRTLPTIEEVTDKSKIIDTSDLEIMEPSIQIADDILEIVKKLYLEM